MSPSESDCSNAAPPSSTTTTTDDWTDDGSSMTDQFVSSSSLGHDDWNWNDDNTNFPTISNMVADCGYYFCGRMYDRIQLELAIVHNENFIVFSRFNHHSYGSSSHKSMCVQCSLFTCGYSPSRVDLAE